MKSLFRKFVYAISLFLPWPIRRLALVVFLGYKIHPRSKIGFAWILPDKLLMDEGSRIGNFTLCKNLDLLWLKKFANIGKGNWISAPSRLTRHYLQETNRFAEFILEDHSAITSHHRIDCTNSVRIGAYSIIAGFHSTILTHSVDLRLCKQFSASVVIGKYCFIGTNAVILPKSVLPDYSVLGANSLLNKIYTESYFIYGGVPAKPISSLDKDFAYFSRKAGWVQ